MTKAHGMALRGGAPSNDMGIGHMGMVSGLIGGQPPLLSAPQPLQDPSMASNKLLHEVFHSLSLADKVALSISLGHLSSPSMNNPPSPTTNLPPSRSGSRAHLLSNQPSAAAIMSLMSDSMEEVEISQSSNPTLMKNHSHGINMPSGSNSMLAIDNNDKLRSPLESRVNPGAAVFNELTEMQSVISETEKESLNNAMSLMGHQELELVEEEVRKIQNNVRGWLLRKNYINLREAARSLQVAWRVRKKSGHSFLSSTSSNSNQLGDRSASTGIALTSAQNVLLDGPAGDSPVTSTLLIHPSEASSSHDVAQSAFETEHGSKEERDKAAATLQAATRRMFSRRKSFSHLRKQTMASLTIQRNLVKWWTNARSNSGRVGGGMMAILEPAGEDALAMDDSL